MDFFGERGLIATVSFGIWLAFCQPGGLGFSIQFQDVFESDSSCEIDFKVDRMEIDKIKKITGSHLKKSKTGLN